MSSVGCGWVDKRSTVPARLPRVVCLFTGPELALAGLWILIKVPPPEFRQGLSSSGYLFASTHRQARRTLSISGAQVRRTARVSGGQAVIRPRASGGGHRTRRLVAPWEVRHAENPLPCILRAPSRARRAHSGIGIRIRRSGMPPALITITIPIRVRRGHPVSSTVRSGRCATRRLQSLRAEPRWPTARIARQRSAADNRGRPHVVVSEPGSSSRLSSWRLRFGQPGTTSVQGTVDDAKWIGELLVVRCQ